MSKMYDKYLILKERDSNKLYLFRCGNFYIFLKDDCDYINEYVVLKKTVFSKDVYKCGFPKDSLEQYMRVFNNHKLDIEIIENYEEVDSLLNIDNEFKDEIFKFIRGIDINSITPLESLKILALLKEKVNERC